MTVKLILAGVGGIIGGLIASLALFIFDHSAPLWAIASVYLIVANSYGIAIWDRLERGQS